MIMMMMTATWYHLLVTSSPITTTTGTTRSSRRNNMNSFGGHYYSCSSSSFLYCCFVIVNIITTYSTRSRAQANTVPDFFINSTTLSSFTSDTNEPIGYKCQFLNNWYQELQPIDFPVGEKFNAAHWGPPLVVSHNTAYQLWCSGCNSSSAFANYVTTGSEAKLGTDIQDNMNNSFSFTFGAVQYVGYAMGQNLNAFLVDGSHPYISAVARAEPSPDWFTGFFNFHTIDNHTGRFYQTFEINTYPWDAGVDAGNTYKARRAPLNPYQPITIFNYQTTPSGVFITADKVVVPVAMWKCEIVVQSENQYGDHIYLNVTAPEDSTAKSAAAALSLQLPTTGINLFCTLLSTTVLVVMMATLV